MIVFKAHIFGIYLHAVDTTYLKIHMTDGLFDDYPASFLNIWIIQKT